MINILDKLRIYRCLSIGDIKPLINIYDIIIIPALVRNYKIAVITIVANAICSFIITEFMTTSRYKIMDDNVTKMLEKCGVIMLIDDIVKHKVIIAYWICLMLPEIEPIISAIAYCILILYTLTHAVAKTALPHVKTSINLKSIIFLIILNSLLSAFYKLYVDRHYNTKYENDKDLQKIEYRSYLHYMNAFMNVMQIIFILLFINFTEHSAVQQIRTLLIFLISVIQMKEIKYVFNEHTIVAAGTILLKVIVSNEDPYYRARNYVIAIVLATVVCIVTRKIIYKSDTNIL